MKAAIIVLLLLIKAIQSLFWLFACLRNKHYAEEVTPAALNFKFKYFGHDQVILHENDIRKARGVFNILQNANVRSVLMDDLNILVEQSNFVLIASAIQKKN